MFDLRKKLCLEGLNLNRAIKIIAQNKIRLFDVKKLAYNSMEVEILTKDFQKLLEIKALSCYNIIDKGSVGRIHEIWQHKKRIGLLVGVIATIVVLVLLCGTLMNINIQIEGDSADATQRIEQILLEEGIATGSKISKINNKTLEKLILSKFDEASLVVVERQGVNLNVFVKIETHRNEHYEGDIVASQSGIIESVKVASGILKVNVGEVVSKGQVLVSAGKVGDVFLDASASVIAKCYIAGEAYGLLEYMSMKRTGKETTDYYFEVLNKELFRNKAENNFDYSETEIICSEISNNNIIPITRYKETIFELAPEIIKVDEAQLIESLKQSAYQVAKNNLPAGAVENSITYNEIRQGNYIKIICNIETMLDIALRENDHK